MGHPAVNMNGWSGPLFSTQIQLFAQLPPVPRNGWMGLL